MGQGDFNTMINLVADGEVEEAIDRALEIAKTQNEKFVGRLAILSCRLHILNRDAAVGAITWNNKYSEMAHIANSFLSTVREMIANNNVQLKSK